MKKRILFTVGVLLSAVSLYCAAENGYLAFLHFLKKPKKGLIKVACVGDSITYGCGIKGWFKNNYPSVLGRLLGEDYCVNNYGYSDRTVQHNGDHPYMNERVYRQSLAFQPDIVLMMLGTNDSKPHNWMGQEAFIQSYSEMVRSYQKLQSHPVIFILAPPPAFGDPVKFDINARVIKEDICPSLKELAEKSEAIFIDFNTAFQSRTELFYDGVHPNAAGAQQLAEALSERIKHYWRNKS